MIRRRTELIRDTHGALTLVDVSYAGQPMRPIHEFVELPYAQVLMHHVYTANPSAVSSSRRDTSFYLRMVLTSVISLVLLLAVRHVVAQRIRRA